jgi:hypothetical protein
MRGEIGGGEGSWSMASWGVYFGGSFPGACLDAKFSPKFNYAKRRFRITLKCWYIHEVLNVDEIKN